MEIIVVDDHSNDSTAVIVKGYAEQGVRLIQMENQSTFGKKAAIARGIDAATHDTIITTDADCSYPSTWINTLYVLQGKNGCCFCCGARTIQNGVESC